MKKQLTALVLCICMVLSVLPFSSTQAAAEETSSVGTSNISIGDYIRLGNYNGQPILWRCVDVDEMGPLMLSDQVLATMAYDAKTSENSATRSHSRLKSLLPGHMDSLLQSHSLEGFRKAILPSRLPPWNSARNAYCCHAIDLSHMSRQQAF